MTPAEFREHGREVVDWIADYLENPERFPVLARTEPGAIRGTQPTRVPEEPTPFEEILRGFEADLVPGITHWNHPGFMAYFGITAAGPGILAEALTASLNVNAMLWRTSPTATELEEVATTWLRQMLGLPPAFQGHIQDTASSSTLVAIATAREAADLDIRQRGTTGRDLPRLRLYCSEEAHSSVEKGAITVGLGSDGVRRIPIDERFRMRADALSGAIEADLADGIRPICVVATVGTTSTTSVDPLPEIAEICGAHGIWLHVDAAYGGAAAIVPELRDRFAGWEGADSIVMNPHKWMFVPIDCSVLFLRNPALTRRAFSLVPEYLRTPEEDQVTNLMDYGVALGRRFRSLKLWATIRYFGERGIASRIREHVRLAELFRGWVDGEPDWEVCAPSPFSVVCFRYTPSGMSESGRDRLNAAILERVNRSGEVFLSHTRLHGRFVMRVAIGNLRTEERHVARAWELLRRAASDMNGQT